MDALSLTHRDCLDLVNERGGSRTALVAVDGREPVLLACFVRRSGDILVPTGNDSSLTRNAIGRPVTIEFADDESAWTVVGVGLAIPLEHTDRPAGSHTDTLTMRYAFDNGILVRIARLTGQRVAETHIPSQRADTVEETAPPLEVEAEPSQATA
ncbi:hypothetical protein SAMN05421630_10867 [Prauserella marina]|uniref:Uncharacterized protein n=1 Tax=Prauserella marina TaxID=530584 RepID=A0A1G6UJ31_9PSEU|nr:hypothetical protein [Prauserella marina]PWV74786.1 hypothetical protein DES30_107184 [Prauserella marina]SDD40726.1 hypothetical protein SAMN05421630_10867 [Prauserella marina]